jgi:hypothetical protein
VAGGSSVKTPPIDQSSSNSRNYNQPRSDDMRKKVKSGTTVKASELKSGMHRIEEVHSVTCEPVPIESKRGDPLARIVPEVAYHPDPANPAVGIPGDVFRDQCTRFLHGASLGLTFRVEEPSGNFIVLPPNTFRNDVSPASLGFWWLRREPSPSPTITIDLGTTLRDHERMFGWIGARLDALEGGKPLRPGSNKPEPEPSTSQT